MHVERRLVALPCIQGSLPLHTHTLAPPCSLRPVQARRLLRTLHAARRRRWVQRTDAPACCSLLSSLGSLAHAWLLPKAHSAGCCACDQEASHSHTLPPHRGDGPADRPQEEGLWQRAKHAGLPRPMSDRSRQVDAPWCKLTPSNSLMSQASGSDSRSLRASGGGGQACST